MINRPERVLETARDRVSEKLQGIPGVHRPRTKRFVPRSPDEVFEWAESEGFDFPFIVREAGLHNGQRMLRITSPDDLPRLHAFPFDGREFYLTEYVDYRDESGLFQRQRIYVIDGRTVLRAALYDEKWKVHGSSRFFMLEREDWSSDRERSRRYEEEIVPRLEEPVREIARRLGLELFGIDCSMNLDGTMLVFEANANMNMLHNPHPQANQRMRMIERAIQEMLAKYSGARVV